MNHPCLGCQAYSKPNRPIEGVICPKIGREITLEGCNQVAQADPIYAQKLIGLAIWRARMKGVYGG